MRLIKLYSCSICPIQSLYIENIEWYNHRNYREIYYLLYLHTLFTYFYIFTYFTYILTYSTFQHYCPNSLIDFGFVICSQTRLKIDLVNQMSYWALTSSRNWSLFSFHGNQESQSYRKKCSLEKDTINLEFLDWALLKLRLNNCIVMHDVKRNSTPLENLMLINPFKDYFFHSIASWSKSYLIPESWCKNWMNCFSC
jgi:hypothetical protein